MQSSHGDDGASPSNMIGRNIPAHPAPIEQGNRPALLFVTVCSAGRKPIFSSAANVDVILDAWRKADHWLVGKYIVLPDHIHFFCTPARPDALALTKWMAFWKSTASRRWPIPEQHPIWQTDAWDTQLRGNENYAAKWEYVRHNAVRHGLVTEADEWPWQGELNVLPWHDR